MPASSPTQTTADREPRSRSSRDLANREQFALRRLIRASRIAEAVAQQKTREVSVREEDAKRAIERTWRAEHWGRDPDRPFRWRAGAQAASRPQPSERRVAWQALGRRGVRVISADGVRVGAVNRVVADARLDIFEGIVITTRRGPGGRRFVEPAEIALIFRDRIVLTLPAARVRELPRAPKSPGVLEHHASDPMPSSLRLRASRVRRRGVHRSRK